MKTLLAAFALTALPAVAMAQCASERTVQMSCADGMIYDAATQSCIVATS